MHQASLPAVAGDARRTPIGRATRVASVCHPAARRELRSNLVNGLRQRPASQPAGERPTVEARGFTCPERSRGNPATTRVLNTRALAPDIPLHLSSAAAKGCHALPGLFRRKSLKTRVRGAQEVSRIRIGISALHSVSNRQCCRTEFAVTHTKQRIGIVSTRQKIDVVSSRFEQAGGTLSGAGSLARRKPGAKQANRETRSWK